METIESIGNLIKRKRLSLNLRMDDVAKKVGITRATLWSIEKGSGSYSFKTLLVILNYLGLSLSVQDDCLPQTRRKRATRVNSIQDKRINRFIVTCVEQYANFANISGQEAYRQMIVNDVISTLTSDYEDLHGMSTEFLDDYIHSLIAMRSNNGTCFI